MMFCNKHGIPHSEFLEWDPDDRTKALAFEQESALRCGLCGTAGWEWEENRQAYVPEWQFCWGCYYKEWFQKTEGGESRNSGESVTLAKNTPSYQLRTRMEEERRRKLESR